VWTLHELLEEVRQTVSTADFSTVFRATTALEKEGRLLRVDLGDGKVRFEPAGAHHDHIQCRSCGMVVAVRGCLVADASEQVARRTGFDVEGHRLLFTGVCPDCLNSR
jgi:Fur family transcriptional regulator, ferric uptake regulator